MPPNGKPIVQRVSRHELAQHHYVWLATAGTFALLALAVLIISLLPLGYEALPLQVLSAYLFVVALIFWRTHPPKIESPFNHLSLMVISVSIALAMVTFEPRGIVALTSAMFIGSLVPFRLVDRGQIAAHQLFASAALATPLLLGYADETTTFAVITLLPSSWVLSACVALVLEAGEAQSDELEQLARRDPLTGAGNRRMLEERLQDELRRHERVRRPLSVLALDLDGFKALNDETGHAAGDRLLCLVTDALTEATASRHGVVIRQGGDEFCVILPETSPQEAELVAGAVRNALGEITVQGVRITSGVGVATYPKDAVHRGVLLNVADERLRDSKSHRSSLQALPGHIPGQNAATDTPLDHVPERSTPAQSKPMSRQEIAVDRRIWAITGSMFAFEVLCLVLYSVNAGRMTPTVFVLAGICTAVVAWTIVSDPVPISSRSNHVLLGAMLTLIVIGSMTPAAGGVFGAAVFVGPLIAVRLTDRRLIALHTGVFVAISGAGALISLTGLVEIFPAGIDLAILTMALVTPTLAFSCAVVLEAAEEQGRELEQVARRDALTGAGNRRMLHEMLEVALNRPRRTPVGLVALDLNGFKALYDVHGHAAGDQLLRDVVAAVQDAIGPGQTLIRLGGDEFCVIVDDASAETIIWTEQAIRTALSHVETPDGPISGGVGSALYPDDARDADSLLNAADERMREDKTDGRASPLRIAN